MPGAIPVVEDMPGAVPSMFAAQGQVDVAGAEAAGGARFGPSNGANTHLWYAGVMLIALGLIVFFHVSGFRFATDVGITRG